ncbi:alpha/beta-hydrolase [Polyplosphaeria fusca]|uniref:Alpha/beta-hydrolase n=1 Tax=Polyplosphaeria fusca TaxID=682080 RepID=A0A9P4R9E3_9PLEO|nr:alpha/beta-hydrolase [Polyplosphaeria fusca]
MLADIAWRGFSFAYGVFNFAAMAVIAITRDGALTDRMSQDEKKELALAQKKYWDVDGSPFAGFRHAFYTARNNVQLHYVTNAAPGTKSNKVIIFIHGFPDSYVLWRDILTSDALSSYTLIAVDLPGFGGSDSLPHYGPDTVLESMAGFTLGIREEFLAEGGKLVMVTHDWGGIVGARLASEAKELADRYIIAGAIVPRQVHSTITTHIASASQMLRTWIRSPFNTRLLRSALKTLSPFFGQIARSFYIFILQLPFPIAHRFTTFGNFWFLRVLHLVQAHVITAKGKSSRTLTPAQKADYLAISSGPGAEQFPRGEKLRQAYGASVQKRISDFGLSHKIRMYRDHVLLGTWEKSLQLVIDLSALPPSPHRSGSGAGLFEDGPEGALKVPATVIYGRKDMAFDPSAIQNGVGDYLVKGSQCLVVDDAGHWMQFEEAGSRILTTAALWAVGDEGTRLRDEIEKTGYGVKWIAEK